MTDLLFQVGTINVVFFCFYIFFTVFAMLNIITGIFLETALNAAQSDRDHRISDQLEEKDSALNQMKTLFHEVDMDNSGELTLDELEARLTDPKLRANLASLGIETDEAPSLFDLLDLDGSGTITIDEFLYGCMRIKGGAKSVDVATLIFENKRMMNWWGSFSTYVTKEFDIQTKARQRLESKVDVMTSLLKTPESQHLSAKTSGAGRKQPISSSSQSGHLSQKLLGARQEHTQHCECNSHPLPTTDVEPFALELSASEGHSSVWSPTSATGTEGYRSI